MTLALRGLPVFVLLILLTSAQPSIALDGPLLPGLEPSEPAPAEVDDAEVTQPPAGASLPVDDSITPLDANGQPMSGPGSQQPLRLPAPPPLPRTLHGQGPDSSLPLGEQTPSGEPTDEAAEPEQPKRNLWKRSTDALRDLTQPKPKQQLPTEQDSVRHWQMLRQRELQQHQLEQRQLQQRELQQRQLQQRQLQQRQLQQRSLQPPAAQPGWDPRTRVQDTQPQLPQRPASVPGVEARRPAPAASPQASSRRRAQSAITPQTNVPARSPAVPPSARARKPSQPREAKNEPRSPWERS